MTKEEAIEVLSSRYQKCVVDSLDATIECERWNTAVDLAIASLEKHDPIVCICCKHYIRHDKRCGYWNHGVKQSDWCSYGKAKDEDW